MGNNCNNVISPVYAVFVILWYSKYEIPGAALELCLLKIKQTSPDILKFKTKHEYNSFTLNCSIFSDSFLLIFQAGTHGQGSTNFRNSSYREKTAGSARVSRLSLRFLWLWCYSELLEYSLNTPSFIFEVQSLVLLVFLISSVLDIGRLVSYCHIHVVGRDQAWLHGTWRFLGLN